MKWERRADCRDGIRRSLELISDESVSQRGDKFKESQITGPFLTDALKSRVEMRSKHGYSCRRAKRSRPQIEEVCLEELLCKRKIY